MYYTSYGIVSFFILQIPIFLYNTKVKEGLKNSGNAQKQEVQGKQIFDEGAYLRVSD
jgi:hypothetical protein